MMPRARPLVPRPMLKPHFRFAVAPDEGVALLSPTGDVLLEGALYEELISLLDGRRSADAIANALGTSFDAAEVFYALGRLQARGYITNGPRRPAQPNGSSRRVAPHGPAVQLVTVGTQRAWVQHALRSAGWRVSTHAPVWLVLAADCLTPELGEVDAAAKRAGRPWLLAVPSALSPTVGPLFGPADEACLACLTHRVARNRPIESYLRAAGHAPRQLASLGHGASPLRRVLQRAAALLAAGNPAAALSGLDAWDDETRTWVRHAIQSRPQCPACGDATLYARAARIPLDISQDAALGGVSMVSRTDLVDSITGVVSALTRHPVPALPALHICIASTGSTRGRQRLEDVLRDLRQQPSGRGSSPAEAASGAMGEAVERYSGVWQGDESRQRTTLKAMRDRGVHPNDVLCYSTSQFRQRHIKRSTAPSQRVPTPFDPRVRIDWSPVWSLTRGEERWLPSSLLYYGHPDAVSPAFCHADSNGCAAGVTRAAALASALLELMERDAVAMWWYNRLRRPGVDLATASDPWCDAMADALRNCGRDVWALDLTNDLGLPTFAAVSPRLTGASEAILLGFGAHPDPRVALRRAFGEMGQMFAATADFERDEESVPREVRDWLTQATVRRDAYLRPSQSRILDTVLPTSSEPWAPRIIEMLESRGFEVLLLDQTRPDIDVPVVRAIVPGLRHFWPRLGPGRLFDVPVRLGWLHEQRSEAELNPTACFL